jgi:hypothetical protein
VLAAVSRSPGNAVIDDIPEPGLPLADWPVGRPEAAGIRGSDCNIIPAIPPVLSGARDYCPRIPGREFCAVAAAGGSAAPSALTPGMPGSGLRECPDLAASAWRPRPGYSGAPRSREPVPIVVPAAAPRRGRGSRHAISETAGGAET